MRWSEQPMLAFDVESTGVDVEVDRVVTACAATVNTASPEAPLSWLIDPGVEIPEAATAIHGVTTQQARDGGEPPLWALATIRARLIEAWELGRPVVAFNATFDVTMLDRELRRHDLPGLDVHGLIVDPLVLDRRMDPRRRGSRKLDAVCAHYGVRLDAAHDSTQDALAAARVAWRLFRTFPDLDEMDADDLYALQADAHRDWADSFEAYLRSQGKGDVIDRSWPLRPLAVAR